MHEREYSIFHLDAYNTLIRRWPSLIEWWLLLLYSAELRSPQNGRLVRPDGKPHCKPGMVPKPFRGMNYTMMPTAFLEDLLLASWLGYDQEHYLCVASLEYWREVFPFRGVRDEIKRQKSEEFYLEGVFETALTGGNL